MGHGKLKKFAENSTFRCLLQPSVEDILVRDGRSGDDIRRGLVLRDHPVKGRWCTEVFSKKQPIILELGCGKGEYTIALAQRHPENNYIGVDIKGARLWKGAKTATEQNLPNVAFLRTRIEFITAFFAPEEVSEIWLTFSDPQIKSENSRLTSPLFLDRYRSFMRKGGIVHLKTDSIFLHEYSLEVARQNGLKVLACAEDIYGADRQSLYECPVVEDIDMLFEVQTFYEQMFLDMGIKITYLSFMIDHDGEYVHPEFDAAKWKSIEGPRRSFAHQRNTDQQ